MNVSGWRLLERLWKDLLAASRAMVEIQYRAPWASGEGRPVAVAHGDNQGNGGSDGRLPLRLSDLSAGCAKDA